MTFAQVIVSIDTPEIDRVFDYLVPEEMAWCIQAGMRVMVPFGLRGTMKEGYVMSLRDQTDVPMEKIKAVAQVIDSAPIISPTLFSLACWMHQTYHATMSACFGLMIPAGRRAKSQWFVRWIPKEERQVPLGEMSLTADQKAAAQWMEEKKIASLREAEAVFGKRAFSLLGKLSEAGVVGLTQKVTAKDYKKEVRMAVLSAPRQAAEAECARLEKSKGGQKQKRVLELLLDHGEMPLKEVLEQGQVSLSPVETLGKKGLVEIVLRQVLRDVTVTSGETSQRQIVLTKEQEKALSQLKQMLLAPEKPALFHGVTGSGKTEVYLNIAQEALAEGKQVILLVPEISLTPQTVERFRRRFGDAVSFTHSRLSAGERADQWEKARRGEISIMVGPRSALFTPFSRLGLVIIDEEHDDSYRSDGSPRYDARLTAEKLCQLTHSLLILGSATPRVEEYYRAMEGQMALLKLDHRPGGAFLPQTFLVDMRQELAEGNRSMFSRKLTVLMQEALSHHRQVLLFLNRRGYASFVSCRSCGLVIQCPDCDMPMKYHRNGQFLQCHICGNRQPAPKRCPVCGSSYIRKFGTGTEKVEEELGKLFPSARVLRMDADTTGGKNGHGMILEQFRRQEADILIGTQMIAKGHDFPNVTVAGVLAADLSLNAGGYEAGEKTYQLLTQVAGRAGRALEKGAAVIQTYTPEHYSIAAAAAGSFVAFYEGEIAYRKSSGLPPFSKQCRILFSGKQEEAVYRGAEEAAMKLRGKRGLRVLGPAPDELAKAAGLWRVGLTVIYQKETAELTEVLEEEGPKGVRKGLWMW
ncbi:MAG: primosomal protein N' [Clostridiales bacterium]|nr:primosomal protein N' [Clostridiales bacterium]